MVKSGGNRRGSRGGFTLIELIVALALIVILAALIVPNAARNLDRERITAGAAALQTLVDAIAAFENNVGEYPGDLRHLTVALVSGDQDCSGSSYSGAERGRWAGPYINRLVPATGLLVVIGTAALPVGQDGSGNARIDVTSVQEADAIALNDVVDGDGSSSAGTVRWTAPDTRGFVTLSYHTPFPC